MINMMNMKINAMIMMVVMTMTMMDIAWQRNQILTETHHALWGDWCSHVQAFWKWIISTNWVTWCFQAILDIICLVSTSSLKEFLRLCRRISYDWESCTGVSSYVSQNDCRVSWGWWLPLSSQIRSMIVPLDNTYKYSFHLFPWCSQDL